MSEDRFFRLLSVIILFTFLPIVVGYRIRSKTDEKLDRWQEGKCILFGLRLSAVPLFFGTTAWMIEPEWMAWSAYPSPFWLRCAGLVVIACWGVLHVWTFKNLGKNLTD